MSLNPLRLLACLCLLLTLAACTTKEPNVTPPTPSVLNFTGQVGQVVLEAGQFSFQNTGNAALSYSAVSSVPWLQVAAGGSGTVSPQQSATVIVRTSCVGAQAGTLSGAVTLNSNAPAPGNVQTVTVQLTCTSPQPAGDYSIEIRTLGSGFTPARQAVFEQAAARWSSIITGDLADQPIQHVAGEICGYGEPAFSGTIDDLLIYASIVPIDGPGQTLASAGPAAVRSQTDQLTYVGCMQFDVDDVAQLEAEGTFDEVILHEMGHVLGIGSLWQPRPPANTRNLTSFTSDPPGQNCRESTAFSQPPSFTGSAAIAEFAALGRSGNVPVEDTGGRGTQCSHWDEEYFSTELMTGIAGPGTDLPLSRLTVASLQDLGYQVSFSQAEPYSIPACSPNCPRLQSELGPLREIILSPRFTAAPDGKLVPLTTE